MDGKSDVEIVVLLGLKDSEYFEGWFYLDIYLYIVGIIDLVLFKCVYVKMEKIVDEIW